MSILFALDSIMALRNILFLPRLAAWLKVWQRQSADCSVHHVCSDQNISTTIEWIVMEVLPVYITWPDAKAAVT